MVRLFKIRIPEDDIRLFEKLLSYDQKRIDVFKKLIEDSDVYIDEENYTKQFNEFDEDTQFLSDILSVFEILIHLYFDSGINLKIFIDDMITSIKSKSQKITEENLKKLENFLKFLLTTNNSIWIRAKRGIIRSTNYHTYGNSKIITDIRPIFGTEDKEKPVFYDIIHNLKISYKKENTIKEFFVTLDNDDLHELENIVKRAFEKEEQIQKQFKIKELKMCD